MGGARALNSGPRVGLRAVQEQSARGIEDGRAVEGGKGVGTKPSRGGSQGTYESMRVVGKHPSRGRSAATLERTRSEKVAIKAGGIGAAGVVG